MFVSSINLGCTKNLVDTQFLLWKIFSFDSWELEYCPNPFDDVVELVFLNTCGFIASGRAEMFETLEKLLSVWKKIYLWGCAVQYFQKLISNEEKKYDMNEEIRSELLYWQKFVKNKNVFLLSWEDAKKISLDDLKKWFSSEKFTEFVHMNSIRFYSNIDLGFEYLKIAEWCNNQCSFCIIPKIRGKQKSLTIDQIWSEVTDMIGQWVKEIILISQDSTRYGVDIYGESELLTLLRDLEMRDEDFMVRVLYMYPDLLTAEWLEWFMELKKFVPYFDFPLQHINSKLLKKMWRFSNVKEIRAMLKFIRDNFENAYIRTNFIVGFPWETPEMVQELADFIGEWLFDNIALFEYHDEPLAPSFKFKDKISSDEITHRFDYLKSVWEPIFELQEKERRKEKQIGFVQDISNEKIIVRPRIHAPEIDSVDEIKLENIKSSLDGEDVWVGSLVEYVC